MQPGLAVARALCGRQPNGHVAEATVRNDDARYRASLVRGWRVFQSEQPSRQLAELVQFVLESGQAA